MPFYAAASTVGARHSFIRLVQLVMILCICTPTRSASGTEPITFSAYYCAAEEVPFVGEVIPPVLAIIREPKIRKELGLTEAQLKKLEELDQSLSAGLTQWFSAAGEPGVAHSSEIEQLRAVGKMMDDARRRTNDVLNHHQLAHLKQLLMQRLGILCMPQKELQQILLLGRSEERAIDAIRSVLFEALDLQSLPAVTRNGCKLVRVKPEEMLPLLAQGEKAVSNLLTPEQRKMAEHLRGRRFSL